MSINNKTLLYQLKEHFGSSIPIDLLPLLVSVNDVYNKNSSEIKYAEDGLIKVKNKARTSTDCERIRLHFSIVQQTAKTGSWEFDFPEHNTAEQKISNDSHVYYFSDEVYRILGLEPGSVDISKDFFFPQLNPYDLGIILENSSGASHDIKQYEEEHTVKMKDGSERIVLKKSDIFFGKNSLSPTKVIGTLQDVTEKRGLENDLRKVKREKENILQNLFNAYLCYDVINNKVLFSK
jgi:PAS domain-containing protein